MAIGTYVTISGANGNFPTAGINYSGGEKTFAIYGESGNLFDGATIKMEASFDEGTNYITLADSEGSDLQFTGNAIFRLNLGQCKLRFVASGSSNDAISVTVKVC